MASIAAVPRFGCTARSTSMGVEAERSQASRPYSIGDSQLAARVLGTEWWFCSRQATVAGRWPVARNSVTASTSVSSRTPLPAPKCSEVVVCHSGVAGSPTSCDQ